MKSHLQCRPKRRKPAPGLIVGVPSALGDHPIRVRCRRKARALTLWIRYQAVLYQRAGDWVRSTILTDIAHVVAWMGGLLDWDEPLPMSDFEVPW